MIICDWEVFMYVSHHTPTTSVELSFVPGMNTYAKTAHQQLQANIYVDGGGECESSQSSVDVTPSSNMPRTNTRYIRNTVRTAHLCRAWFRRWCAIPGVSRMKYRVPGYSRYRVLGGSNTRGYPGIPPQTKWRVPFGHGYSAGIASAAAHTFCPMNQH